MQLLAPKTSVKGKFLHEFDGEIGAITGYQHKRGYAVYISYLKHSIKMVNLLFLFIVFSFVNQIVFSF